MAIQIPTLANLNVAPPNVANPLDTATKKATLQNMLSEQALRQQLAPFDVQEAQARASQASSQAQTSQLQLQTTLAQNKYWSDPTSFSVQPGQQANNDQIAGLLGVAADDPILAMVHGQIKAGVPAPAAIADAKATLEFRKTVEQTTEEHQKVLDDSITHLQQLAAPAMAETDPAKKAQLIEQIKPQLAELAKGDPAVAQLIPKLGPQNFDAFVNRIGAEQATVDYRTKSADLWKKELDNATTADPLLKMATNPGEAFSGDKLPASIAFLQSKIKDPDPKVAAQATKLLGQAKAAEGVELAIDTAKKQSAQAIQDGDPNAAAKLLVDGTVSPSQLISSRKPEFAQKAFTAAAALQPGWSAQKAEADFNVAKSPQNVSFFGSLKSLTDPGGTLDQLKAAGNNLPQGQIPIFNSFADIYKAQTGSDATARYAASLIGVADDYAKVTGGGAGTEGMQKFIMSLVPAKASPEQRDAAIDAFRGSLVSQGTSRIGNNQTMQKMYGNNLNATRLPGTGKSLTLEQLQAAAKGERKSLDEVKAEAKKQGYGIP